MAGLLVPFISSFLQSNRTGYLMTRTFPIKRRSWFLSVLAQKHVQCHFSCILLITDGAQILREGKETSLLNGKKIVELVAISPTRFGGNKEDEWVDGHTLYHPKIQSTMSIQERDCGKRQRGMHSVR